MMHTITKTFKAEAAHHLPLHAGKCRNPHGHSYRIDVTVRGVLASNGSSTGMVVDFDEMSAVWREFIEPLFDHRDLNYTIPSEFQPTTAEHIASWVLSVFQERLPGYTTMKVDVWETATGRATAWA